MIQVLIPEESFTHKRAVECLQSESYGYLIVEFFKPKYSNPSNSLKYFM